MFQRQLTAFALLLHTPDPMSSNSPQQREGDSGAQKESDADVDACGGSDAASRVGDPSTGSTNAEKQGANGHSITAKQEGGAEAQNPNKAKAEAKLENMSKTKRAKLEIEKAVGPNRVHELLLSCGNAFCGDLSVEQISLSPTLIPSVRAALDAIGVKDIGVTESDIRDEEPQHVTIHSNPRFSLVVHLLPPGTSMSFLSHKSLLSVHRILYGSITAHEHVAIAPEVPEKSPEKKRKVVCTQDEERGAQELFIRFNKEHTWTSLAETTCFTHEDTVLELTSTSATIFVQLIASPKGSHLSGARFVLKPQAEEEEDQKPDIGAASKKGGGEEGGCSSASTQMVKTEGAPKEGEDSDALCLIAMEGGGSMGQAKEYAGRAWGPVAMGTRMAGSRRIS